MKDIGIQRTLNGIVWILCGVILIVARALLPQTFSTLVWQIIGAGMIMFGAARLVWGFVTSGRSRSATS